MKVFIKKCKREHIEHFVKVYNISAEDQSIEYKERVIHEYWEKNGMGDCPICLDTIEVTSVVVTPCSHLFCDTCLLEHLKKNESCPICRESCIYCDIVNRIIATGLNQELIEKLRKKQRMDWATAMEHQIVVGVITLVICTVMTVAVMVEAFFIIHLTNDFLHFVNNISIKLMRTEDRMI
jgi:hypothetical protein